MKDFKDQRVLEHANIFLSDEKNTIRCVSKISGWSKSTVHKDLAVRLKHVSSSLFADVDAQLTANKDDRHIRGGEATKQLWK